MDNVDFQFEDYYEYDAGNGHGYDAGDGYGCGDTHSLEGQLRGFGCGFGAGAATIDTALRIDGSGYGCNAGSGTGSHGWMERCELWTVEGVPWVL